MLALGFAVGTASAQCPVYQHPAKAKGFSSSLVQAFMPCYGSVTLFSEGDPTPGAEVLIPAGERQFTTCRHAQVLKPGELGKLAKAEGKHFMVAGAEGAIVSEYATYHDNKGLRFTDPKVKF